MGSFEAVTIPHQPAERAMQAGAFIAGLEVYRSLASPEDDTLYQVQTGLAASLGMVSARSAQTVNAVKLPIVHFSDYTRLQNKVAEPPRMPQEGIQAFVEKQLPKDLSDRTRQHLRVLWNGRIYVEPGVICLGMRGHPDEDISFFNDRCAIQKAVSSLVPPQCSPEDAFQNSRSGRYGLRFISLNQYMPPQHREDVKKQVTHYLNKHLPYCHPILLGPVEYEPQLRPDDWYPRLTRI